jgi:hypothetical protein
MGLAQEISMGIEISVSHGEALDKISILEIKSERISDPAKLAHVHFELTQLHERWQEACGAFDIGDFREKLKLVNETLWEIEDRIRAKEKAGEFDESFIELARQVYLTNDQRSQIKRQINEAFGSSIVEQKEYASY